MNSPRKPPQGLRKQALKKIAKMKPEARDRLLKIEALRRGLPAKKD